MELLNTHRAYWCMVHTRILIWSSFLCMLDFQMVTKYSHSCRCLTNESLVILIIVTWRWFWNDINLCSWIQNCDLGGISCVYTSTYDFFWELRNTTCVCVCVCVRARARARVVCLVVCDWGMLRSVVGIIVVTALYRCVAGLAYRKLYLV